MRECLVMWISLWGGNSFKSVTFLVVFISTIAFGRQILSFFDVASLGWRAASPTLTLVETEMNFTFHTERWVSWLAVRLLVSQERLITLETFYVFSYVRSQMSYSIRSNRALLYNYNRRNGRPDVNCWHFTAKVGFLGDTMALWMSLASDYPTLLFIHLVSPLCYATRYQISDPCLRFLWSSIWL
jgi:hypothetical protein